jgi:hypothetical protein
MIQFRILPLLLVLPLAGCIIPVPVPPGTPGSIVVVPGDSCGARGLRRFVGQPASAIEGVRLVGASGAEVPLRVIRPGDAVAQDLDPERVNVRTDSAGTVTSIDCG